MRHRPSPHGFESREPFAAERIQAAAVYCSDGRYGEQMDDFLHNALELPRYDRMALPGGAGCLAGHLSTFRMENGLADQLRFLIPGHQLARVILIAHQDCVFYLDLLRVPPERLEQQQRADLVKAARRIREINRSLVVDAFFARRCEHRVRFEPVEV